MQVHVDVAQCGQRNCIDVTWGRVGRDTFSEIVGKVKAIPGRRFVKKPNPHWHVPLDMESCRSLRAAYGEDLVIGTELLSWARAAVKIETKLSNLTLSSTATLERLPHALPALYQAIHLGPLGKGMTPEQRAEGMRQPASYQAADVAFLASARAPLNANQPGLGKTIETIASIWEAGLEEGDHLIIAPVSAVDGVWEEELALWQADSEKSIGIFACTGNRSQREKTLAEWAASTASVRWVIINPAMIGYRKDPTRTASKTIETKGKAADKACRCDAARKSHEHYDTPYPAIADHAWKTVTFDECQSGIRNHRTLTAKAVSALKVTHKKMALSGTPMKGKGSDLWGTLNYLRPDVFTSFWRFAGEYFEIEDNGFGKRVGNLKEGAEEKLFRVLAPYILRRTKAECLPWLPPKQYVDVWVTMGPQQEAAYRRMELEGEATLGDNFITTTSVLAEFTRLKQFATALCDVVDGKVVPTETSCKLEAMLDKMDEYGMFDPDNTEQQVVFSQSREVVELAAQMLRDRGLSVDVISGAQNKRGQRKAIKEAFMRGDTRVLCIVTTAGGVALTLDAASVAHMLDEMWDPGDDEQAEDRLHRASRVHQVIIYNYRTKGTIDQYIMETAFNKASAHSFLLDVRRRILEASQKR